MLIRNSKKSCTEKEFLVLMRPLKRPLLLKCGIIVVFLIGIGIVMFADMDAVGYRSILSSNNYFDGCKNRSYTCNALRAFCLWMFRKSSNHVMGIRDDERIGTNVEFVVLGGDTVCHLIINGDTLADLNRFILSKAFYDECISNVKVDGYFYSLSVVYDESYILPCISRVRIIENILTHEQQFMDDIFIDNNIFATIIVHDPNNKWIVGGYWKIELDFGSKPNVIIYTNHNMNTSHLLNNKTKQKIIDANMVLTDYFKIIFNPSIQAKSSIPAFNLIYNISTPTIPHEFNKISWISRGLRRNVDNLSTQWIVSYNHTSNSRQLTAGFRFGFLVHIKNTAHIERILNWVSQIEINAVAFGSNHFAVWNPLIKEFPEMVIHFNHF